MAGRTNTPERTESGMRVIGAQGLGRPTVYSSDPHAVVKEPGQPPEVAPVDTEVDVTSHPSLGMSEAIDRKIWEALRGT